MPVDAYSKRDHYGLRALPNRGINIPICDDDRGPEEIKEAEVLNKYHKKIDDATCQLRDTLDINYFLSALIHGASQQLIPTVSTQQQAADLLPGSEGPPPKSLPYTSQVLSFELHDLKRRLQHAKEDKTCRINTLQNLNHYLLSREPHSTAPKLPEVLFRFQKHSSHSPYDEKLGIRCPGWRKYGSAYSELDDKHISQHLNYDESSPPLISVSSKAGRIINFINYARPNAGRVLILSGKKMQKLGVRCLNTTTLAESVFLDRKNGLHYVSDYHWLVHKWIPRDCIEREMNISEYFSFCRRKGILTGDITDCIIDVSLQTVLHFPEVEENEDEDGLAQATQELSLSET